MKDTNLDKNLDGLGNAIKKIITDALLVEDIRMQRTASIDFLAGDENIYGKGLYWKGQDHTRQLVYRANPDRIFTSESIDLQNGQEYMIGNIPVISAKSLGPSVIHSDLVKVGTLQDLRTQGSLSIDETIYYNAETERLGFGTESPNGTFAILSLESEFVVDVETENTRIGNYTTDGLDIITDNTTRIGVSPTGDIVLGSDNEAKVSIPGKLGVGVKNPPVDASITTAGPIRFQDKKFEVGENPPKHGSYKKGDVVWNSDPKPTGYVGWICTREGTPGVWKPFGQISS